MPDRDPGEGELRITVEAVSVNGFDVAVTSLLAAATPEKLTTLLDAVTAGALEVPVAATYPMDRATATFGELTTSMLGKIVLTVP